MRPECTLCLEQKPIRFKVSVTDAEGYVLDGGEICWDCASDEKTLRGAFDALGMNPAAIYQKG